MQNRREQQQATLLAIAELTGYSPSRHTTFSELVDELSPDLTEEQIKSALEALEAKELIKGIHTLQSKFMRSMLTPQGLTFIDDGRSLTDAPEKAQGDTTFNFHGPTTNVQVGDNNTQNVNVEIDLGKIDDLIEALRADGEVQLADEAEAETRANGKHAIGAFLGRIVEAALKSGVASATATLLPQIMQ
ncbi:hypothetical protein ACNQTB_03380 [Corynebacterium diphtheriae]